MIEEDIPAVAAIEEASFSIPWTRGTFFNLLKQPSACLFSAVDRHECIVGYAAVWFVGDEAELGDLAVDRGARRNGVGSLLLQTVVEEVRERAFRRVFLEVRESNDGAQSLYRRHGFEIAGCRRNYYTNPIEDAVLMQCLLIR
jgi:ribosomal-protein-alanine N-acetyltransferase